MPLSVLHKLWDVDFKHIELIQKTVNSLLFGAAILSGLYYNFEALEVVAAGGK